MLMGRRSCNWMGEGRQGGWEELSLANQDADWEVKLSLDGQELGGERSLENQDAEWGVKL